MEGGERREGLWEGEKEEEKTKWAERKEEGKEERRGEEEDEDEEKKKNENEKEEKKEERKEENEEMKKGKKDDSFMPSLFSFFHPSILLKISLFEPAVPSSNRWSLFSLFPPIRGLLSIWSKSLFVDLQENPSFVCGKSSQLIQFWVVQMANIGVPIKLLHEAQGHVVTCELMNGEVMDLSSLKNLILWIKISSIHWFLIDLKTENLNYFEVFFEFKSFLIH